MAAACKRAPLTRSSFADGLVARKVEQPRLPMRPELVCSLLLAVLPVLGCAERSKPAPAIAAGASAAAASDAGSSEIAAGAGGAGAGGAGGAGADSSAGAADDGGAAGSGEPVAGSGDAESMA